jgi:hypothetical protein
MMNWTKASGLMIFQHQVIIMAEHLFIVPGYSDEDFSFLPLANLLNAEGLYSRENIRSIEYASLDDQVDFRDFADKFDKTYDEFIQAHPGQRIDVLAHSTGSLVVRAWLYLRRKRQQVRNQPVDVPIDHLFLFAPANFGSDLAKSGRSALNAVRVTFTKNRNKEATLDGNRGPFETGKKVLEGLEPASPIQWELSNGDLHHETYFGEHDPSGLCCFPFVFAAGRAEKSLASLIVKELQKDGTDSTVRIAGTSLNTRLCKLRFNLKPAVEWDSELIADTENHRKYQEIAFAIFGEYDHCGIINENGLFKKPQNERDAAEWKPCLPSTWQPLDLLKKAKEVRTPDSYKLVTEEFDRITQSYIEPKKTIDEQGIFQQFFFKVSDDTGQNIPDFFILFLIYNNDPVTGMRSENKELTKDFRSRFGDKTDLHIHSVDSSHGMLMLDITRVEDFVETQLRNGQQIVLRVVAKSPYNGVTFPESQYIIFEKGSPSTSVIKFFAPFTTTLVNVILGRQIDETVLGEGDFSLGS